MLIFLSPWGKEGVEDVRFQPVEELKVSRDLLDETADSRQSGELEPGFEPSALNPRLVFFCCLIPALWP